MARTTSILCAALVLALSVPAILTATPGDSPVADAAMRGDAVEVRALLENGADVNAAQGDGMTALHWAALNGDAEMARMLLYAGANLESTTRIGAYTPLAMASRVGAPAVVDALLQAGADPAAATSHGTTPLMLAAGAGSAEAVTLLLDHGAGIDVREPTRGQTALAFAAAAGRVEAIEVLLSRGADPSATSNVVDIVELERLDRAERAARRQGAGARQQRGQANAGRAAAARASGRGGGGQSAATRAAAQLNSEERREEQRRGDETEERRRDPRTATNPAAQLNSEEAEEDGEEASDETAGADDETDAEPLSYGGLVGATGGLAPLHFAARQGHLDAARALVEAGVDIDQPSGGDHTTPLLMATINGHFDLATFLLEQGADPTIASDAGATPLYAALNVRWAPKALYPQPRAWLNQETTHLELMEALLAAGADPNVRLKKKLWYSGYNFDLSGVNERGATPFWRAAYALDVPAMRLLVAHGADPTIPTKRAPARRFRRGDDDEEEDPSGLPPVPIGGPSVTPLLAASGVGYGEGFAANSHRHAPEAWMPTVKYLVEELGADVNARDHEGYSALHHAAARGDNEMILYLVSKGADVTAVARNGRTVADMANGPVQRIQPFSETVALLEKLGSKNNHACVSC